MHLTGSHSQPARRGGWQEKIKPFLLGLICLWIAGCASQPAVDHAAVSVQTDQTAYTLVGEDLTLTVTYANRSDSIRYLGRCGFDPPDYRLEKEVDGSWQQVYGPVCPLVFVTEPFEVGPGETQTATITIYTTDYPGILPGFEQDQITGRYRLVYSVYGTWQPDDDSVGELLPLEARISNEFTISTPDHADA